MSRRRFAKTEGLPTRTDSDTESQNTSETAVEKKRYKKALHYQAFGTHFINTVKNKMLFVYSLLWSFMFITL